VSSLNENLRGRDYWRSLEQLAAGPEYEAKFAQEFHGYEPDQFTGSDVSVSRRSFMKIMGAAMGLAGLTLTGCRRWPEQQITPHAHQPEGFNPGVPVHYATMLELSGVATGLLVKSYDGRPIKIEGNALHPFSLGATDPFAQASVLDIYDPERLRTLVEQSSGSKNQRSWDDFTTFVKTHFGTLKLAGGKGLAVVSEPTSSPTTLRMRALFQEAFPQASWHVWEPLNRDNEVAGSVLATGKALRTHLALDKAAIIVSFDADLLGSHPARLKLARDWAKGRLSADEGKMNRLYVVESNLSITGSASDHRLPVKPSAVRSYLYQLAAALGLSVPTAGEVTGSSKASERDKKTFAALIADLKANPGASVVAVGPSQPADLHALGHAINQALGNLGKTITFTAEPDAALQSQSIKALADAVKAGQVQTLLVLGGNPLFDAPADLGLVQGLKSVKQIITLSHEINETCAASTWSLPRAHYLECWGDGRAWDGTLSVQQPLILPLFEGKSPAELLALVLDLPVTTGMELVRQTWAAALPVMGQEAAWRTVLHDGVLKETAWPAVSATEVKLPALAEASKGSELEARFVSDLSMYDGRFANNGWLQEMPDPMTKLTWDNAALVSKADADRLSLKNGDMVKVDVAGAGSIEIVALIQPGVAQGTVVLQLGYGRAVTGQVGASIGVNVYPVRSAANLWIAPATVTKTGKTYVLAATQEHHLIDAVGVYGREKRTGKEKESGYLIREATLDEYLADRKSAHRSAHAIIPLQLYEAPHAFKDPHAWGMTIDMNSCIGCNACVIACQSENNIPIVGKESITKHREMHWLRIDRYYKGDVENPDTVYAPTACVHCENAPCEQVCPVAATVHDTEGLNTMVYNRCIGTRYCSNNCPYKVRRFNYFDYHAKGPHGLPLPWLNIPDQQQVQSIDPVKQMVFNPEVTVRMRGVMEKCTYCTQRIQAAKISAKLAHTAGERDSELVKDGEIVTACQSSCPTQAITFGNLNDEQSKVSKLQRNNRAYEMLEELNIKPRTHYLAKVRNPNATTLDERSHDKNHG
jgi:MoCo/4Fe-4S cofactor protein with predicted Tat translocation signal